MTLPEVNKTGKIVCESHTKIEQVPIEQRTKELVKNAMIKRGDCLKLPGAKFVKIGRFHNIGYCTYEKWTTKTVY